MDGEDEDVKLSPRTENGGWLFVLHGLKVRKNHKTFEQK